MGSESRLSSFVTPLTKKLDPPNYFARHRAGVLQQHLTTTNSIADNNGVRHNSPQVYTAFPNQPLADHLSAQSGTADPNSFAYISARERWPVILVRKRPSKHSYFGAQLLTDTSLPRRVRSTISTRPFRNRPARKRSRKARRLRMRLRRSNMNFNIIGL